ncbi:MAG: hypothetical protein V3S33_04830 [Gammaproteobacteria bacterium]
MIRYFAYALPAELRPHAEQVVYTQVATHIHIINLPSIPSLPNLIRQILINQEGFDVVSMSMA